MILFERKFETFEDGIGDSVWASGGSSLVDCFQHFAKRRIVTNLLVLFLAE